MALPTPTWPGARWCTAAVLVALVGCATDSGDPAGLGGTDAGAGDTNRRPDTSDAGMPADTLGQDASDDPGIDDLASDGSAVIDIDSADTASDTAFDTSGDLGPPDPPCGTVTFAYDAGTELVTTAVVAGTFNDWGPDLVSGAWPMSDGDGDNVWSTTRVLDEGTHQYKFIIDGDWRQDPANPDAVDDGFGGFNSVLVVDCTAGRFEVLSYDSDEGVGRIEARVRVVPGDFDLDPARLDVTLNHGPLSSADYTVAGGEVTVSITGLPDGIHDLRLAARASDGRQARPVLLKFHIGVSTDWADDVVYFAMTDRFRNGDTSNDAPVPDADARVNWQGGDFAGLEQIIEEGYFDDLGVNALWISWPIDNFDGSQAGGRPAEHHCGLDPTSMATVETRYTAFHGYWPRDVASVDAHFGTLEELQQLVSTAHAHGIRLMLDLTANHVHTSSPLYTEHRHEYFNWPDSGYQHVCVDVGWETEPETCWFTDYLADLDYRNPGAVEATVGSALDWIYLTGADGFRVDAVKHINREFLRVLRRRLRDEVELTGIPFYLVGETFTGDTGQIASYIGDDLIHGQFDFPLNLEVLRAFATREIGLNDLDQSARDLKGSYGAGLMSNFIGNHDIARFVSMAAGDLHCGPWDVQANIAQGWLDPPGTPSSGAPYQLLRLAFTFIMTVPGVPLIYYGDEFGMPGAGDPDNRRMMRFGAALSSLESDTLDFMRRLGAVRAAHPALRTGSWGSELWLEPDVLAYSRTGSGETILIVLNRGAIPRSLPLGVAAIGVGDGTVYEDALSASPTAINVSGGQLAVEVPARSPAIFVPR